MEDRIVYNGFYGVELIERKVKCETKTYERLKIRDAVAALVIDTNNKVALVYQYRPTIGRFILELPAGLMDKPGLTIHQTLQEELYEECYIKEKEIKLIKEDPFASYFPICGASDTILEIYEVYLNCVGRDGLVNDTEVEMIKWFTKDEVRKMVERSEIYDGKTLIGLNHFIYKL